MVPMIGDIVLFAFDFAPKDWVACEGQELRIADYEVLYSIIGKRFGGSLTTFFVPDLRNIP